jgi:hypothetical protein
MSLTFPFASRLTPLLSIWQKVINNKYLKNTTLINCLRQPSHHCASPSKFWSSLIRTLPIILHWIRWCPRAGSLSVVGRDKILGMSERSLLSAELLSTLEAKNISTLAHASQAIDLLSFATVWRNNDELGLSDTLSSDWNNFTSYLSKDDITL